MFLQGYPQALLPLTVAGIPSMHICLDFIPELLAQPQLEKQVSNYQFSQDYYIDQLPLPNSRINLNSGVNLLICYTTNIHKIKFLLLEFIIFSM